MLAAVRHLFVCTNTTASGKPACGRRGGAELLASVGRLLIERGGQARVTPCGCLGPCFDGPNAIVYPDGVWYADLNEADADAIVAHLLDGVVYEAKRTEPPGD
jgi:(2Fe-2S) ferredoxin